MMRSFSLLGGSVLLALLTAGEALAQAPAIPAPSSAPPPAALTPPPSTTPAPPVESAPIYAPPPTPGETLPATPAPTPYSGPTQPEPPANGYPTPGQPPPPAPTAFDFGGQSLTPLPPPPPPLDASRIKLSPWRGRYWIGLRAMFTGPLAGEVPARPNLLTLSAGADFGVRINNVLGLGMGLSGHIQNRIIATVDTLNGTERKTLTGRMLYWDALFARIHAPLRKRFQPYIEVGGGLANLTRAEDAKRLYGAQTRLGLGVEGWVSRNVTLGVSGVYRLTAINDREANRWIVGHAMNGIIELGFHW